MEIGAEKARSMVISKNPVRRKLAVEIIEHIIETDYLEKRISSVGKIEEEISHQTNEANRVADAQFR